jgi:uncharacterized delta-60 repeat protein
MKRYLLIDMLFICFLLSMNYCVNLHGNNSSKGTTEINQEIKSEKQSNINTLLKNYSIKSSSLEGVVQGWVKQYNGEMYPPEDYAKAIVYKNGYIYITGYIQKVNGDKDIQTVKYSSNGEQIWVARYNCEESYDDEGKAIVTDLMGNIYVTGISRNNCITIKYNPDGEQLWIARFEGTVISCANAIAVDSNNNVYITGYCYNSGTGDDYLTVKYNSDGVELWNAILNGIGNNSDRAIAIATDKNNNIYVTGYCYGSDTYKDFLTVKYNTNGEELWSSRYDNLEYGDDEASALITDSMGNVYVTGCSYSATTNYDVITIKYNSTTGFQEWITRYSETGYVKDVATSITKDESGNIYVTGYSEGFANDILTIKYNAEGNKQWAKRYNGSGNGNDVATAMTTDNFGNLYVTGYSEEIGSGRDYITIKYDSTGKQLWATGYKHSKDYQDEARAITTDNFGNIYITGNSVGVGYLNDFTTIKYNPEGEEEWVARYDGPGKYMNDANAMTLDKHGNIYITGASYSKSTYFDYATIKYNIYGEQVWVVRYNDSSNYRDEALAIVTDNDGNTYVTGYSEEYGSGKDYLTIKYNSDGEQLWVARYNGIGNDSDVAKGIALDKYGNVYVTGYSYGLASGRDLVTIKYSTEGKFLWEARYNGSSNQDDEASSIAVDSLGNVYVTGYSYHEGTSKDNITIKYNSEGEKIWVKLYNNYKNKDDIANAITLDTDGNVYVTGYSVDNESIEDCVTIKYGSAGENQWIKSYITYRRERINAITADINNDIYVGGYCEGVSLYKDYLIIKYNSEGDVLWLTRFQNEEGDDAILDIATDMYGNAYVTGYGYFEDTKNDFLTIKYTSEGKQIWMARYDGTAKDHDVARALAVDSLGNVYVTGTGTTPEGTVYSTVKYVKTDVLVNDKTDARKFESNVYPNPFSTKTAITFTIPEWALVEIEIFDALGRKVTTSLRDNFPAGSFSIEWDASEFPCGIYFYRLVANGIIQTGKLLLQR